MKVILKDISTNDLKLIIDGLRLLKHQHESISDDFTNRAERIVSVPGRNITDEEKVKVKKYLENASREGDIVLSICELLTKF